MHYQEFINDEIGKEIIKKKELALDQTGTIIILKHVTV